MEADSPDTRLLMAMMACTPARRAQMLGRDMLPTRIRPTRRVGTLCQSSEHADRIVAAITKRGSMSHRELQKQRCYRSLDADDRDRLMVELAKSGRVVVHDTRTHRNQPASSAVGYSVGAQD